MKRPSFQFYPADWSANSNLRRCTHEEKGIWIDVMCLLHDQEEYGVARWSLKEIAQAIGCTVSKLRGLVVKGVIKGCDAGATSEALVYVPRSGRKDGPPVTIIGEQDGPIWYSSRMAIDEYKRVLRGEYGATPKAAPDSSPKGGIGATPKAAPDSSPKGGIGATPKSAPDSSPSRVHASSSSSSSPSVNPSVANATGGEPPKMTPEEIIFSYGVPLLVNAGSADKQARSFLGGLRKEHGDEALVDKLRECLKARPLQPLEWLAAALPPKASSNGKSRHSGFDSIDYRAGVTADGKF